MLGDIILEAKSPDPFFDLQRDTYGAHYTHVMIYVGVRDGKHMVIEARGPGQNSTISPIEGRTFTAPQIVRVKVASDLDRKAAARVAEKVYVGVPYGWEATNLKNPVSAALSATKNLGAIRSGLDKRRTDRMVCSSLVWNAWMGGAKVDLDSDYVGKVGTLSSLLVMPKSYYVMPDDIAMSDKVKYVIDIPLSQRSASPQLVEVPVVVGKSEAAAKDALRTAGLHAWVSRQENTTTRGTVFAQSPAGGKAKPGSTVDLRVSTGPKPLETVTKSQAAAAIKRAVNATVDYADARVRSVNVKVLEQTSSGTWWAGAYLVNNLDGGFVFAKKTPRNSWIIVTGPATSLTYSDIDALHLPAVVTAKFKAEFGE